MKIFEKQEFPDISKYQKYGLVIGSAVLSFVFPLFFRTVLKLPVFLDQIGNVLISVTAGPAYALMTAVLLVVLRVVILSPLQATSILTFVMGALVFSYMAKYGWTKTWPKLVVTMVLYIFVLSIGSATTTVLTFGGYTGDSWDIAVAAMVKMTGSIWSSVFVVNFFTSMYDKIIVVVIVLAILRGLPPMFRKLTPIAVKPKQAKT